MQQISYGIIRGGDVLDAGTCQPLECRSRDSFSSLKRFRYSHTRPALKEAFSVTINESRFGNDARRANDSA